MNKKLWLSIILVSVVLVIFVTLNIKKVKLPLPIKGAQVASIADLTNEATQLQAKGSFIETKSIYQRLISEFPNSPQVENWQKKIEDLNIKLLFSPTLTPKSIIYEIRSGDTLSKIAKNFKTTVELIKRANRLNEDKILPGRKIKVWTAHFSIVVDKSQNTLILKSDEEVVKTYIVSTGTNNSTPTGNLKIVEKLINPPWFKPGSAKPIPPDSPENILGSRWLGLNLPGYGIHGTTESQNLGKQITQGCVRMSNSDVEELYTIVPIDTEVTIVD